MLYGDMSQDRWVVERYRIARELIGPLEQKDRVLDVGCYDGFFLSTLANCQKFGLDSDEKVLKRAHKRGISTYLWNVENGFSFHDRAVDEVVWDFLKNFDVIVCMEVLEHLKNPAVLMKAMRKAVKRKGRVVISIPNDWTIYHRMRVLFGKGIPTAFENWYHLHLPTLKQSDAFVSKYFKIIEKRDWCWGLPQFLRVYPTLFARGRVYLCSL